MNYRAFILAILLMAFSSAVLAGDNLAECESKSTSCDFYSCIEQKISCGCDGYFIGFGERFCRRFDKIFGKLSPQGKEWFMTARQCLTNKTLALDKTSSCHEIEEQSYNDHKPCYISSGYCDLPKSDKAKIIKVVFPLLLKKNVFVMGKEIQLNCLRQSRERVTTPHTEKEMP